MCLIAFSFHPGSATPIVLASNRDEFFSRPTEAAHWWPDHASIYGGRDTSAGGTWLALRRIQAERVGGPEVFRLAALTNYRDGQAAPPNAISRGAVVTDVLLSENSVNASMNELRGRLGRHAGFNLIAFEWQVNRDAAKIGAYTTGLAGWHLSNRGSYQNQVCPIEPGNHALSNASFNEPWPKSLRLQRAIESDSREASLLTALTDACPVAGRDLPDTGIDKSIEQLLATPFIRPAQEHVGILDNYGTRSSSILRLHADGVAQFHQWTWDTSRSEPVYSNQRQMIYQPPTLQAP